MMAHRHVPWALDDSIFPQLCETLRGTHDYSVFVHKQVRYDKSQVMTIDSIDFEIITEQRIPHEQYNPVDKTPTTPPVDDKESSSSSKTTTATTDAAATVQVVTARLVFRAKGFRRTMVRNLVGFCVDRCRGAPALLAQSVDTTTTTTTTPPSTTTSSSTWNDNQLWTFDNDNRREQVASKIHAAPASGLCLDHVLYD
jgi:tRNA U38,U39,U40 pseudouridine synthase TruA